MYIKRKIISVDLFFEAFLKASSKLRSTCALLVSLLSFMLCGCQPPGSIPADAPTIITQSFADRSILGFSVQNRPIETIILGSGPDITLIIATIHGNESAGTPLLARLKDYLLQNRYLLDNRTVVLLPIANPDGMANNTRSNANGIDLNRNFASENRINSNAHGNTPLSEPESQIIVRLIARYQPNRIVSIHQPLACIDYDGPGLDLANHIASCCDLPVRKLGGRPGSLGSYSGITLEIPIITLEMLKQDSLLTPEQLWQKYGPAILASITYPQRFM